MAERLWDEEDRLLGSMLALEPIDDAGFSDALMRRVRRQQWIRRLAVPVGALVGLVIAAAPMMDLVRWLYETFSPYLAMPGATQAVATSGYLGLLVVMLGTIVAVGFRGLRVW